MSEMRRVLVLAAVVVGLSAAVASAAGPSGLRVAEHYVARHCHKGSARSHTMWITDPSFHFNALYGDCGGGDGHEQRIWFFRGSRFVGHDDRQSSGEIIGSWRNLNTLAFLYVLYRPADAMCCPTGGAVSVRYRWNGKKVVRLDPLPPRTASKSRPGRYP
jgi:LppP/LprE lipoprotein